MYSDHDLVLSLGTVAHTGAASYAATMSDFYIIDLGASPRIGDGDNPPEFVVKLTTKSGENSFTVNLVGDTAVGMTTSPLTLASIYFAGDENSGEVKRAHVMAGLAGRRYIGITITGATAGDGITIEAHLAPKAGTANSEM